MEQATGRLVQVLGGVVDVEFPAEDLPELYEAIVIERPGQPDMILEVQKQLEGAWVRCIAMDSTDGLVRGYPCGAPLNRLWSRWVRIPWAAFLTF